MILRNAFMRIEKSANYLHRDCLHILMLLNIMLYLMPAYLMLFTALFNAVCLHSVFFLYLTFGNAFCVHALSWVIDTAFYFKYYFASCTVFLICWFSKFFTQPFFMKGAMFSLEK